jgi:hypothetical protein
MNPKEELNRGVSLLNPILTKNGFSFVDSASGNSSGGSFASGYYEKGKVRLNLSVRFSLGCVTYQIEGIEVSHEDFLYAHGKEGEYPGFCKKPIDAFRHLRNDLENHLQTFLSNTESKVKEQLEFVRKNAKKKGFKVLP